MMEELRRAAPRGWWVAAALLLALGLAGLLLSIPQGAPGSDADARIEFYKARIGGRGTYPSYARLGAAYLQKARETGRSSFYHDAENYLLQSLRFQRNYEALRWLADLALARHQFRVALAYARETVQTMPGDLDAQGALFDSHLALGDVQSAAGVAERMMQMQPGFASLTRRAALRESRGDWHGAVETMARACQQAEADRLPAEPRAWCQVRLGSLHLSGCEPQKAEAAYRSALRRLPRYFRAEEHLAELRAAQGNYQEAIRAYQDLAERTRDPRYPIALAELYSLAGDTELASRERQRALAELRRSAGSGSRADWHALAMLLLDQARTAADGLQWAQKDFENRRDVIAAEALAWAYYRNGRLEHAAETIEHALQAGSRQPSVLYHAALIYHRLGRHQQARAWLEQALACPFALRPSERADAEKHLAQLRAR